MNKKTWYIWLSILGFVLLWGDTTRRIKFRKIIYEGQYGLWARACGNILKLFVLYIMLPIIVFGNLIGFFSEIYLLWNIPLHKK